MDIVVESKSLLPVGSNNGDNLMTYPSLGNHLILDFYGVEVDLNDLELLDCKLREVLSYTSVTIESMTYKKFYPQGVTLLYLLSESHFSIHTWPEIKACAIDFYHCGPRSSNNLSIAEEKLCDFLGWKNCTSTLLLSRGFYSSYLTNSFVDKSEILRNVRFVHREKTPFQEIRVYDTLSMGRILVLDGAVQISSKSLANDNYTRDMTRFVVNNDRVYEHIVIIGGGDMVIATYLLEHYPNIHKVTVCEIDERVVSVTREYFSIGNIVNEEVCKGRLELVFEGGASYMQRLLLSGSKGSVDGIIVDCTDFALDEGSIAAELFTSEFFESIYELLGDNCYFSQQITKMIYKHEFTNRVKDGGFGKIEFIISVTPEYGGELPIAICRK